MATINNNIILTFKGDVGQLNMSIDQAISKLNTLVQATQNITNTSVAKGGGIASAVFNKNSQGVLQQGRAMFDNALGALDKSVTRVSQRFAKFQKSISSVGDALRLTSQAVSTLGRVWSVLISAPLGIFMMGQAKLAIDFEDALTRVRKVTNYTAKEMLELRDALRDVAINTSTSHMELAQIAEVLGQAGIRSQATIIEMTETINMFSIATGIAADEAATNLIRIGNAFNWTEDEMAKNAKKMGSVFNMLENTNATTAKQVMKGTAEWAQQAKTLGIAESAAAAYTSTLISMGLSESEAGTAMKRFTAGLIQNIDEVANAMEGIEGYSSAREIANRIDEDAVKVINDIVYAAEAGNSAALKLADSLEIGGVRGGRAIVALANNTELMRRNLERASKEWDTGLSLVQEYELAMTSTKNQMALLRNNINDVGITMGDALLPEINKLIMILVPAIRQLNKLFKSLDDGKKQMIIFGGLAAIALGPVMFMFGQLINSISLIILGFGRLLLIVPSVYGFLVSLVKPVLLVGRAFLSWPAIVLGAVIGIVKILSNFGLDVAGFFIGLGEKAVAWGERLAQTYASGFLAGAVRYIAAAIQWVANMIASFFRGASPPKVGPLSTIDKWGSKVMEAYLKGFRKADFSILSSVGKTIEQALTRGLEGKKLAGALQKTALARLRLSELVKEFNKTGKINDKVLGEITNNLGPIADNVRSLIRHWLEYNRLQERIAQIEERRKEVKKSYYDELKIIAATNSSMKDKVEAIRAAQRARDDDLRGLTEEQEMLEEQADEEKEKYEYQQQMIDAMQEQDDLLQRMIDALKQVADAAGGISDALGGGFGDLPNLDDLDFETPVIEAMDTLEERLNRGKQIFEGLLDGWFGKPNAIDQENAMRRQFSIGDMVDPEVESQYDTLYEIGTKAREIKETITGWVDSILSFKDQAIIAFDEIKEHVTSMIDFDQLKTDMSEGFASFDIRDIPFIGDLVKGFESAFKPEVFGVLFEALQNLKDAFADTFSFIQSGDGLSIIGTILTVVGRVLGFIAGVVVDIVVLAIALTVQLIAWAAQLGVWIWKTAFAVARWFKKLPKEVTKLKRNFLKKWDDIKEGVADKWEEIKTAITDKITEIKENLSETWTSVKEDVASKWEEIKTAVSDALTSMLEAFGVDEELKERWRAIWEDLQLILTEVWERIKEAVAEAVAPVVDALVGAWEESIAPVIDRFKAWWTEELVPWWEGLPDSIKSAVRDYFIQPLIDGWNENVQPYIDIVTGWWDESVVPWFQGLPETIKTAVNDYIIQPLIAGWNENVQPYIDIITGWWDESVVPFLESLPQKAIDAMADLIGGFVQGITDNIHLAVDAITEGIESVIDAAKEALGIESPSTVFMDIGVNLVTGFIEGIMSKVKDMVAAVQNFIQTAIGTAQTTLDENSPSKVFKDLGKGVGEGFSIGVSANTSMVDKAVSDLMGTGISAGVGMASSSSLYGDGMIPQQAAQNINININDPVVRSDEDIETIVREVKRIMQNELRQQQAFGGYLR